MADMLVINDDNYSQFTQPQGFGFIPGEPAEPLPMFSSVVGRIPRSEWKGLIEKGKGTWLSDLIKANKIKVKNQDGLGYCWCYASTSTVETLRAIQGQSYVELSPESCGGPVANWRNVGGYGQMALKQLTDFGACEMSYMDRPNSLTPSRWKSGWQENAKNYKITASFAAVNTFDDVMTALLLRMPVSIGLAWWSHQVEVLDPVLLEGGGFGARILNSWAASWGDQGYGILTESRLQPMSSFAAISAGLYSRPSGLSLSLADRVNRAAGLVEARLARLL